MIIPDINLLIYAYDSHSPHNLKAAEWWRTCMSSSEPVGIPTVVIFGYMRLASNVKAFRMPLTPNVAARHVRAWIERPIVQVLEPGPRHVRQVIDMLEQIGVGGNLVTDAQIAALAIEYDAVVHTSDADFLRFPGVRWWNPITAVGR